MIVIVNPSIAQESPVTLNSSHDPAMLRNISHIDSPVGMITHRYLFSWDDIPGNDTGRLITILKNVYRIEWAKTAKIEKIDDGKTIFVSTEINSLSLKLNDEKTKVNLTIKDNRTDEFIVRMNNNKLNIYKNFMDEPARAGLFSRNNNQSGRITGNAYFVPKPQIPPVKSRNRFDITSLKSEHKPGELLVKYTKKLPKKDFENFYKSQNITLIKDYPKIGYHLIRVDESRLENTIESLSRSNKFENTEPNYIVKALKTPNDPRFNELWAMNNRGIPDADIDALQAWDIFTGSRRVIVAVIDTGVDYTHEDLAENMWTNSGEIPDNGIDDDHNGFVDDYYGWDFAYDDNNPMDVYFHGTHVSGTIGGAGNNGKGVAGVSWDVSIMAVKFIGDDGWGYTSDAIEAINYATMMGADIMSNSWGGGEYSSALEAAIRDADEAGILFVAAAGNWAEDTDQYPNYPSGYDVPNVMSIAATDKNDNRADFSNYGVLTVDLGAPGVDILSSVPGNLYSLYSGTSMAAPHVSGAAALLKAFNPSLTHHEIKNILMKSVDPLPSLYGKTVTGGRLNVQKALTFALTYSTVCPIGCDYTSIQAAIDAANPGNTIIVRGGTYYENVNISKQLILRGFGSPVVDARGSGSAIKLSADGIILEGFTVTGGASYLEAGIKIISNNNTLSGNNASNNALGIVLESSSNNVIYNNIFNNTENVQFINSNINKWNITRQSGTNIIGGIYLSGNMWAKPDGTGFGQKCDDNNLDGICDSAYALNSNNIDYLPFSTKGSVHNINKGTNYTTIQAAINDASPGDEIHVDNGTYYENVNVTKWLILRGIGMPVVNAGGSGSAIMLAADGITLDGFYATMAGRYIDYYYNNPETGIRVTSNNNTLINNNANKNYGYGIYLDFSSNNTLIGNNANENKGDYVGTGIFLSSSSNNILIGNNANFNGGVESFETEQGIYLSASNNNILMNNNANDNNGYGIVLSSSINNTLIGNYAIHNAAFWGNYYCPGRGILLYFSSDNTLIGNNADQNCEIGISLDSSSNNMLSSNNASNNSIMEGSGIFLWSSNNNTLSSNNANSNGNYNWLGYGTGIILSSSNNNMLTGNNANSNNGDVGGYGISLSSSSNNTLSSNNASNNGDTGISLSSYYDYWNNIYLESSSNNTLSGNNANSNSLGIFLDSSNYNNITSNNISNSTSVGIKVYDTSTNNTISGNKVTNGNSGIFFVYAFNTTATNNIMENNLFNFGVGGNLTSHFEGNNIYTTNLADGRPVYYVKYAKNTIYGVSTKASTFYCILCNNVTIKDLEMSNMDKGVYFWETNNSRLQNITVKQSGWGIFMRNSSNNSIKDSKLSTNNLQDYSERGVTIYSSDDNTLTNNTFILNNYGIELFSSTRNTIYNNYFNNTNNFLFSGSILKNTWNVTKNSETNIIGGPYLGGNFWANPSGNGFSQTCSDNNIDGLCDLKYSLNTTNVDYLPLKYKSAPGITVVSPNSGENWNRGTSHIINWTSTGNPGAYVKIELFKGGVWKSNIILSTLNDGSHPWLIPATLAPGNDYKVKITSTTNAAYTNTSDNTFNIPVPTITVLSPNGTDIWTRGTTKTIKWNSTGSPGAYVKIELLKPGKLNQLIISATPNDGSHPWLIPAAQAQGSDYKVRITSTANAAYNDTGDSNFTIPVPSFKVISPNGSESWTRGTIQTIRWNSTENPKGYVKIELLKPGKLNQLIISATLNDGSHPWLILPAQVPGSDYKVKITSTINASNNDSSDTNFTIPIPSFKVISPDGGENWTRGTTRKIKWNSTENPKGYVKIELLKSGILSRTIVASTLNDGSQTWPIPATQASGTDYKIRISSTSNPAYTNSSKSNFSISI